MYKTNITLKELQTALDYAKEHGRSKFHTITLHVSPGPIGDRLYVSVNWDDENPIDISDYDSF